jgi:hypothetical protein
MDFDPQNVTGRVKPAQSPMVSSSLAPDVVSLPPGATPAPPPPGTTERALAPSDSLAPHAIEGTGGGPEPAATSRGTEPPRAVPSPSPSTCVPPPPPKFASEAMPGRFPVPRLAFAQAGDRVADEELALMYVLRIIDRVVGPGTLSPVERAFVAGARVMFEHLAEQCRTTLDRRAADVARGAARTPTSLGSTGSDLPPTANPGLAGSARKARSRPKTKSKPPPGGPDPPK